MQEQTTYNQLQPEDRITIATMRQRGFSMHKVCAAGVVRTMLGWKWSLQQISATLWRVFPHQRAFHVSHETIHTAI
jgi:IS30 family transposase